MTPPPYRDFDSLHGIAAGKHFYQFYKNQNDYLRVMIAYFRAGLEKGEACLWLVPQKIGVQQACVIADSEIPRFLYYLSASQFQIRSAEDWYLTDGSFDEKRAMANAQQMLSDIQRKGFHLLRAAGDLSAIPREDWEKVHDYEAKIDPWIRTAPVIALCAYPILELNLLDTKSVVENHDGVLVGRI